MIHYEHLVGRLVVTRVHSPITDAELDRYDLQRGKVIRGLLAAGQRVVNFTDIREARAMMPEHVDRITSILKGNNPFLERAVYLIGPNALALQVARILREAKNPSRRCFYSLPEAENWLAEVLSDEEMVQLRLFARGV